MCLVVLMPMLGHYSEFNFILLLFAVVEKGLIAIW
jgi:hypothetical protein